jgi:large conductance mechanosensitive channel
MLRGFRNFLLRGDVIVVTVGMAVAMAFSSLVDALTGDIINPLIAAALGRVSGAGTFPDLGGFISAIIDFMILMAVAYFLIVLPYKVVMARLGKTVFGDPPPTMTCRACLSDDLNPTATRCKHCGADIGRATA